MKAKDETFPEFKNYKAWAENSSGQSIQTTRDDKGGEYMSKAFERFCKEGITRQHTVRNRPQQNGAAERLNRTLQEGLVTILLWH